MTPKPTQNKISNTKKGFGALIGVLGLAAAALLVDKVPKEEGTEYRAYKDIAGIWTICNGDTNNVRPGMVETKQGCQDRLIEQLIAHAEPVMKCTPALRDEGRDFQRAAAVSLAYNIGVGAYCKSSVARNFNARKWRAGCDSFMAWNKARVNGTLRPVAGLTNRRAREREICLRGL